jgi:predicted O-methyltransferase YrrM
VDLNDDESAMTSTAPHRTAFSDKLLPDQPLHRDHFTGSPETFFPILFETIIRTSGIKTPYEELDLVTTDKFTVEEMGSNPVALRLLQLLIRLSRARRILEIGAFIGVSAIYMAKALPSGGELVTIEKFDHFADICRRNIERNGLAQRITVLQGDAHAVIESLPRDRPFDFIFIDGNKERYGEYMRRLEPLLAPGGLMIVDDALFHGDSLNPSPTTEKGRGVRDGLDLAAGWAGYCRVLLPIANGMLMMMKNAP